MTAPDESEELSQAIALGAPSGAEGTEGERMEVEEEVIVPPLEEGKEIMVRELSAQERCFGRCCLLFAMTI